ncbi:GerMN domain-containing protein [Streptomyces sp. NPDC002913]
MRSERAYGARRGGPRRAAAVLAAVVAGAALAAGCGIRSTSVPVDAGAAPSRMPCRTASADSAAPAESVSVRIYLVCASQLVPLDRTVEVDEARSDRLVVAQALLGELQQEPSAGERRAGFSTVVPAGLRASGARKGDPAGTLRLSEQPEDLPAEALAQVVCTYTENEAVGGGGSVLLGGPGDYAPRGYLCTAETKARPMDVPTLGAAEPS